MQNLSATFRLRQPGYPSVLAIDVAVLGHQLPHDYIRFMAASDGGEGFIGEHYISLWKWDDLQKFNEEYEFAQCTPALVAFGSNGAGEAFAFDMRERPACVVIVPFIGLDYQDATWVAASFDGFLTRLQDNPNSFWGA